MANNIDEFNEEARSFVARAKAQGKSNTGIMNTIRLKYQMFNEEQSRKITPYQQTQIDLQKKQLEMSQAQFDREGQGEWQAVKDEDGNISLFNPRTGETKPYDGASTGSSTDILNKNLNSAGSDETQDPVAYGSQGAPYSPAISQQPLSFDPTTGEVVQAQIQPEVTSKYDLSGLEEIDNRINKDFMPANIPLENSPFDYVQQPVGFTSNLYNEGQQQQPSQLYKSR